MSFEKRTLGEICDQVGGTIRTGPFGSQLHQSDYVDEGIPVVMPKNIGDAGISVEDIARVDEATVARLATHKLQSGDIVYGRRGDIGRQALIGEREAGWLCGTGCLRISLGESVVRSRYLHYYLRDRGVIAWITNQAIGATMPNLNTSILRRVPVSLPALPDQDKIAAVLSTYDDLIENNTRRIAILEEMARALYREWFVHFRFPGHENVKMVESELGMIPEGWLEFYADQVDFKEGPGLRNWQYRDKGIPFLNIRVIAGNDVDMTKVQYVDPHEVKERYSHFLLEPLDHVVSSSGTLGRVVTIRDCHLPLMLNTSVIRMRPAGDRVGRWQLKHFLLSEYFQDQIQSFATGAAQPNYGPSHLKQMWIVAPDAATSERYEQTVEPIEDRILNFLDSNANLRTTRDLLLPKLISGELDVSDLDIEVLDAPEIQVATQVSPEETPDSSEERNISSPARRSSQLAPAQESDESAPLVSPNGRGELGGRIHDFDTNEVMAAFRQAAHGRGTMTRNELLKEVSIALGYQRLGNRIEERLRDHLRAAIRRKIVGANGHEVWPETPDMASYERDELVDFLVSVMPKGREMERGDVIRALANHLGFTRVTETVEEPIKSAINGAIRRGILGYDGSMIWRDQ